MKSSLKIYPSDFKVKVVELSFERNNISELARELGITASRRIKIKNNQLFRNFPVLFLQIIAKSAFTQYPSIPWFICILENK